MSPTAQGRLPVPTSCTHPQIFPGLDHCYCPDCKSEFSPRSSEYKSVHRATSAPQSVCSGATLTPAAPEHLIELNPVPSNTSTQSAPEHTDCSRTHHHWCERYSKKRGNKVHEYYRYLYMEGRKLHHHHIPGGNTKSFLANHNVVEIEQAIARGESPEWIRGTLWKQLIPNCNDCHRAKSRQTNTRKSA